jgi:hypothetical protein
VKKFLAVVMSIIMVAVIFCGCSSNDSESENSQVNIKYTYDSVYSNYDTSTVDAYEQICDAVVKGEESVRVNVGMLDDVKQLIYTSFPLYNLIDDIVVNSDNSGVTIKYTQDSESHLNSVNAFMDKIAEIQDTCGNGTVSDGEYVVNVYSYVASHINESTDSSLTSYDAIMNDEGTSYTYSNMFEYLLEQSDIPAYHIITVGSANSSGGISCVQINDNLYYFDVMSEYKENGGTLLHYFGMTSEEVNNNGQTTMLLSNQQSAPDASDLTFDVLRESKSWEIKDDSLLVTVNNDDVVEIALS